MKMGLLSSLWAHARYEMMILFRGWFFRIFAIVSMSAIIFFNVVALSNVVDTPWIFKGLKAFAPYLTTLFLNIVQTALVVFLTTDIFKRDKKQDTSQVIYIRSITNIGYIWGKLLGLLIVFGIFDLVVLLVSAILQITIGAAGFSLEPFVLYPLIIILPTFIFAAGLSAFLMRLFKNQALTIVFSLGILAVAVFYLTNSSYGIFDALAVYIPLVYSDFNGISRLGLVLSQRAVFFFFGLFFIFTVGFSFERLMQSEFLRKINITFAAISVILALVFGLHYYNFFASGQDQRELYHQLNAKKTDQPIATVERISIDLVHGGNNINVSANVLFKNENSQPIEKYLFSLNPGLEIQLIKHRGQNVDFDRDLHLVEIEPEVSLNPDGQDSLIFIYEGSINENILFAGVEEEKRNEINHIWLSKIDKRHAYVEPEYVLLPGYGLWYPKPGLPDGVGFPEKNTLQFAEFQMTVQTGKNLIPLAQGERKAIGERKYLFTPEVPLLSMSLLIGDYQENTIEVDSITYNLAVLNGHDDFKSYFSGINDTLPQIIRKLKEDYERVIELSYPYRRLQIIETPVTLFTYKRKWTLASPRVQPEQVWLPENGIFIGQADFRRWTERMERMAEDMAMTELEQKIGLFKQFFQSTVIGNNRGRGRFLSELISEQPGYDIVYSYFSNTIVMQSQDFPLLHNALEAFVIARTNDDSPVPSFFSEGLTTEEEINLELDGQSIGQLIEMTNEEAVVQQALKMKGDFLLLQVEDLTKSEDFYTTTIGYLDQYRHQKIDAQEIIDLWDEKYHINTRSAIEEWYRADKIAAFKYSDFDFFKVYDGDRMRYQVLFSVHNVEEVTGLLKVRFRFGGRRERMMGNATVDEAFRTYQIEGNTTQQIGIVLDEGPRMVSIDGVISKNIPISIMHRFEEAELKKGYTPFEGMRLIEEKSSNILQHSIIVDNTDPEFTIHDSVAQSLLLKLLDDDGVEDRSNFVRFNFWRPPSRWGHIKHSEFFGTYIHSAYFIRPGDGDKKVRWNIQIPESGTWEVYTYIVDKDAIRFRRRGGEMLQDFNYQIYHDDGVEPVTVDVSKGEEGWNYLGNYYFSAGKTYIEMTDQSKGRFILADAVKLVRK